MTRPKVVGFAITLPKITAKAAMSASAWVTISIQIAIYSFLAILPQLNPELVKKFRGPLTQIRDVLNVIIPVLPEKRR